MKIFLSTDMEGTAGVVDWEQCVGDSPEAAATELALWFSPDQLLDYERDIDRWVLAPND